MFAAPEDIAIKGMPCASLIRYAFEILNVPQKRFVAMARKINLPPRRDPNYVESLRSLHSAILGLCALIESLPYSVEPWLPPLTEGITHLLAEFVLTVTLMFPRYV